MALLDCIVKYGVSDEAAVGAWGNLCIEVAFLNTNWQEVALVLRNAESEYKERSGRSIPAAYRSAKSVLKKAMEAGVAFIDVNGAAVGKSAVEAKIKEGAVGATPMESFTSKLSVLRNAFDRLDIPEQSTALGLIRGTFTEF